MAKSSITFGNKFDNQLRVKVEDKLGIFNEDRAGVDLGLPECFSGSKRELMSFIKRTEVKIIWWYAKTLSHGGKEVLLKAVAMDCRFTQYHALN